MSNEVAVIEQAPVAFDVPPFRPGIYTNDELSNPEYHAVNALSSTGAKILAKQSAYHYQFARANPPEPTLAMQMGTAVHTGVLEPEKFEASIICVPADAPRKPTAAQWNAKRPSVESQLAMDWWTTFNERAKGKLVLDAESFDKVHKMVESVRRHDHAMALLEGGHTELTLMWQDAGFDVPCKCRFDHFGDDMAATDLKTCRDASPDGFARAAADLGYHLSAAHYWSGAEHVLNESPKFWAWICVENVAPYATAVYMCPPDALRAGMRLAQIALGRYRVARSINYWPGYEGIQPLNFPRYALKFNE